MKKLYYIVTILASLFCLQGCDDFLNVKPKSVQIVSKVEDFRDVLASYMRILKVVNPAYDNVLGGSHRFPRFDIGRRFIFNTGEVMMNNSNNSLYDPESAMLTPNAITLMSWMEQNDDIWNRYYDFLGAINVIIWGVTTSPTDDEKLRDYVKGEALVWRAYGYFKLLQYYCPYMENEYGLPLHLKPYEDPANARPSRENQKAVYKRILDDLGEVLQLLERTPSQPWNSAYHPRFVYGMLASVYNYKAMSGAGEEKDLENALKYAELVTVGRQLVNTPEKYSEMFNFGSQSLYEDDEFYFRLVDGENGMIVNVDQAYAFRTEFGSGIRLAPENVVALYKEDDIRRKAIFKIYNNALIFDKYSFTRSGLYGGGVIMLFRLAESYLIKAEALCRLGREPEAKKVLDDFKIARYSDPEASYSNMSLLEEILMERKREFYHEQDMWWLDNKRVGVVMERELNGLIYKLEARDFRYTFPIPKREIEYNPNMKQNPGWDLINL